MIEKPKKLPESQDEIPTTRAERVDNWDALGTLRQTTNLDSLKAKIKEMAEKGFFSFNRAGADGETAPRVDSDLLIEAINKYIEKAKNGSWLPKDWFDLMHDTSIPLLLAQLKGRARNESGFSLRSHVRDLIMKEFPNLPKMARPPGKE